jgi:D-alanyl-lipoteichoic acid acyltransferase DltB (MBOAT superfamily)
MLFNSYLYLLVFLPLALLGFAGLARVKMRLGFAWLVLMSFAFYGVWNPDPSHPWTPFYIVLMLASCIGNYYFGRYLSGHKHTSKGKRILTVGVVANLGLLGYYKYAGFLAGLSKWATGWPENVPSIVLPLAISFFTFLQIAYLVDAFRGETEEYHFTDYLLFVTFFPHLIAGPLVHHKEMLPQFTRPRDKVLRYRDFSIGFTILVLGLFKKVVLADYLARTATPLFELAGTGARPLSMGEAWAAMLAYTLQLYFDFSGYSDMAIGSARLFGIRFPLNFHSPYKADSVIEFWRRWHITLSRFLRDYLYIPLGGNRKGKARRYVNLMLTMVLGGLWHGAGWTFLWWGFLHGLYLCVNHAWFAMRKKRGWKPLPKPLAIGLTFLFVMIAWVFFRAPTFEAALAVFRSASGVHGFDLWPSGGAAIVKDTRALKPILAGLLIIWLLPNTQQFMRRYRPALNFLELEGKLGQRRWWEWRPTPAFAIFTLALLYATARDFDKISEFIYFQF